ncbi:hypothetical protein [Deinococcus misasensis]|uniref:hypothetical protein n=1 Tax=Deinococcus misasensis TaxID=392413 RepID=UPI00055046D6|nr:hypothetical protein [Deinococcus misasensis]
MASKNAQAPQETPTPEGITPANTNPGEGTETKDLVLSIEQHALQLQVEEWQLKGVKARNGWPIGQRMRRSTFEAALDAWLHGTPLKNAEPEKAEPSQSETKEA